MSDPQPWKTLRTEMVLDLRWYKVRREEVQLPDGRILDDYYVSVRPEVALVFPVTAEGEVIMVRQYKHGAREILLELPGGVCDADEPPEEAARRELLEETGYAATRLTHLATLHDDPTKNTNRFHLFLAEGAHPVREQALDETENIRVERVPLGEMKRKVLAGEITVANSVAITFLALEKLGKG
ncbi:MAG: NUDIX hydrolase [Cytophagales bacterium]|nr:NUDIX hydrolase [Cytophagales bacterium]